MKNIRLLSIVSAVALVVLPACKKSGSATPQDAVREGTVNVELPKLEAEFANASPELRHMVNEVKMTYFRGQYMNAMMTLDKLSADPSLTESQKKLVANVIEEVKKVITARSAPAGGQ